MKGADVTSMTQTVVGGVDTHKDLHVVAAVGGDGPLLGWAEFPTDAGGYRALTEWLLAHGELRAVGVEGTGSYGAGLTRYLISVGLRVWEVDRPDRSDRRRRGKSDPLDAEMAARAVLSGRRLSPPKNTTGAVESLRVLHLARAWAVRSRTKAVQLIRNQVVSAPEAIRRQLRSLTRATLIATLAGWRPDRAQSHDPVVATKVALRSLARRIIELDTEISQLDELIEALVATIAPDLLALCGIGPETAAQLLITAGDNPQRLRSEPAWAMLCGVAPLPASSGKTNRHRLSRGGDRQANRALHMIALNRLRYYQPTITYAERRSGEGKTKREIIRCIKRYITRDVYPILKAAITT